MSLLGIDIGSSNVKGAAYSADGVLLAHAEREYATLRPQVLWAELDSQKVVDETKNIIREIAAKTKNDPIQAISFSSLGEAMTPVSKDREILGNAIVAVADSRGAKYADKLVAEIGPEELYRINPNIATANYSYPKLAWLRDEKPDLFEKTEKFLLFGELLFYLLGIDAETSFSHANRTLLFDINTEDWSDTLLERTGISRSKLPSVASSGTISGKLSGRAAAELSLESGVACVVGAHDQCSNSLGAGIHTPGRAVCGIGTVECVAPVYGAIPDLKQMRKFGLNIEHNVIPGQYTSFIYNQAGSLVKWFRNTFAQAELKAAASAKSGSSVFAQLDSEMPLDPTKLLVLPYFEPTGAPGFIQNVSGSITGLSMSSTRGDILKAILECETFYFIDSLDMLKTLGIDTTYFVATGGGSKSDPWLQIKADIFGVPFERCATPESSVLGDVMIAAKAIGIVSTYEEAVKVFVKPGKVFEPNLKYHSFYQEKYEYYKQLYPALRNILPWTSKA